MPLPDAAALLSSVDDDLPAGLVDDGEEDCEQDKDEAGMARGGLGRGREGGAGDGGDDDAARLPKKTRRESG